MKAWISLDREAPRPLVGLLGIVLLALPIWVMGDVLEYYFVRGDDFVFIADSRTPGTTLANLLKPHNAHVVPLFRVLTFTMIEVSGGLAGLPAAFRLASVASLLLAILAAGHIVAREFRSTSRGLAAMALLGISTVVEPAVLWYSACQALWSGVAVLAMLAALQDWRESGRTGRLVLAAILAAAAPAWWSGGYVAGPTGFAYLWFDGRPRCRQAAFVPLVATLVFAATAFVVAGNPLAGVETRPNQPINRTLNPVRGLLHTGQAIPEVLGLANLGIDAITTPTQGLVFTTLLAGAWACSRRSVRPSPLEAAGATMILVGFGLVYTFRSGFEFESLRSIGWYHTVPQLGAVLLVSGWSAAPIRGTVPGLPERSTNRGLLLVAGLATALVLVHLPRAQRLFLAELPAMSESERLTRFPIPDLQRLRGRFLADERTKRQRRFLARIDRASRLARDSGLTQEEVRKALGARVGPGMPANLPGFDAANLLPIPAAGPSSPRAAAILDDSLMIEADPRPPWLDPRDSWPPR